jgi:hypothetical protein
VNYRPTFGIRNLILENCDANDQSGMIRGFFLKKPSARSGPFGPLNNTSRVAAHSFVPCQRARPGGSRSAVASGHHQWQPLPSESESESLGILQRGGVLVLMNRRGNSTQSLLPRAFVMQCTSTGADSEPHGFKFDSSSCRVHTQGHSYGRAAHWQALISDAMELDTSPLQVGCHWLESSGVVGNLNFRVGAPLASLTGRRCVRAARLAALK